VFEAGHDLQTTSYPLWTLDRATVSRLADEGGIEVPTGPPGSVVMFHGNLVHASPPNISPWDRSIVYLSLCEVSNHIRRFKRAEWIAHRDFTPIEPLDDDCLLELARQTSAAAE
jgi:ectoine hydroxylase